jgi:hypothetical protein
MTTLNYRDDDYQDIDLGKSMAGQRVETVTYDRLGTTVIIKTDRGTWKLEAEGDCCSSSYFTDFDDYGDMEGKFITKVIDRSELVSFWLGSEESKLRRIYGLEFHYSDEAGDDGFIQSCFLEMRNDSNGYYGGSVRIRFEERT